MTRKILVVPDVHGRTFWKATVKKYMDEVDRIVFLGDYLDPYRDENGVADDIFANFMEIIDLKRNNPEKVVLLKGNHDQHYASEMFRELAGGTRMDKVNWGQYHDVFNDNKDLFKLAHLEKVKTIPYVFTHAGLTVYWLNKVNSVLWHLNDNEISVADQKIIERINALDSDDQGQELLAVIGKYRTWIGGEKTGSVLWADVNEHPIPFAIKAYGLDSVFQVFGHTRLGDIEMDRIEFENFAMIDSQKCFIIDGTSYRRIMSIDEYEIM